MKWRIPEIRWVADFRDLWTRNPNFRGMFPFTCLEGALERRVLSRADAVVTVSEGLADALRTGCPAKVYVIENGFDEEDLDSIPATVSCTGVFTLVYTGTIYVSRQDPIPLFAALKALLSQRIVQESRGIQSRFLVTNRQGRDYLEELVESYGLQRPSGSKRPSRTGMRSGFRRVRTPCCYSKGIRRFPTTRVFSRGRYSNTSPPASPSSAWVSVPGES